MIQTMNYHGNGPKEIFLKRGTRLVCPNCRWPVAEVEVDLMERFEFDYRAIKQFDDGPFGISPCCLERYITFDGVFYTEFGAV